MASLQLQAVIPANKGLALMGNKEIMEKMAKEKHTVLEPISVSMPVSVKEKTV